MELSWEDLDIFVGGEFSVEALIEGEDEVYISGIFDERSDTFFDQYGTPASGRKITFLIKTAPQIIHGIILSINNKRYQITEINPENDGLLTRLVLKDVS